MEEQKTSKRVRMNLSQSAKGLFQIDATAEFETVEDCKAQLDKAIKAVREIIADNNLKEAGE
jgi:hypothetical protein